jgi:prophage regulatory protein
MTKPYRIESGDKIARRQRCLEITGISHSTRHRLIVEGKFPLPIRLGPRAVGWPESWLYEWLNEKVAEAKLNK